jgi:hypothetical protein
MLAGKYIKINYGDEFKYGQVKYRNGQYYIDTRYEGEWIVEMSDGRELAYDQSVFEIISETEYTINVVMDT